MRLPDLFRKSPRSAPEPTVQTQELDWETLLEEKFNPPPETPVASETEPSQPWQDEILEKISNEPSRETLEDLGVEFYRALRMIEDALARHEERLQMSGRLQRLQKEYAQPDDVDSPTYRVALRQAEMILGVAETSSVRGAVGIIVDRLLPSLYSWTKPQSLSKDAHFVTVLEYATRMDGQNEHLYQEAILQAASPQLFPALEAFAHFLATSSQAIYDRAAGISQEAELRTYEKDVLNVFEIADDQELSPEKTKAKETLLQGFNAFLLAYRQFVRDVKENNAYQLNTGESQVDKNDVKLDIGEYVDLLKGAFDLAAEENRVLQHCLNTLAEYEAFLKKQSNVLNPEEVFLVMSELTSVLQDAITAPLGTILEQDEYLRKAVRYLTQVNIRTSNPVVIGELLKRQNQVFNLWIELSTYKRMSAAAEADISSRLLPFGLEVLDSARDLQQAFDQLHVGYFELTKTNRNHLTIREILHRVIIVIEGEPEMVTE